MNHVAMNQVVIHEKRARERPAVGDTIDGRYELLRDLGRGGAGVVFEARHVYTRRIVAIKTIREDRDASTVRELVARLLREAEALAAARDPGIVDVLDAGVDPSGMPYLVLECLEGRTLEGLLTVRGRISTNDAVAIGLQLARALAAAHRVGVLHRDVKPSNVFVTRDAQGHEHTKLVDFGIARLDHARPLTERKLSVAGALIGTPEYMSPEQLLAREELDARSDVYALGVTLFECLTGEVPYSGTFAQVLLLSASQTPPPSVREGAPGVPEAIAEVIARALAKPRDERFPNMESFARALAEAAPNASRCPALLGPPPLPARPRPRASSTADTPPPSVSEPAIDYTQKRRAPRAAYVTPVRIIVDGRSLDGRSEDISESGMLVLCRGECPQGQAVAIRFASPIDGRVVTLSARVRWIKGTERHDQAQRAIGVEFDAVPDDVRRSIHRYAVMMEDPRSREGAPEESRAAASAE